MQIDVFNQLPLFEGLSFAQRNLLRPLFIPCEYHGGTVLFEQGDPAENLYLILVGEVVIRYKPEDGPEITLAHLRDGGIVGWSAAFGRSSYTSGASCISYTQALRVRGEDLREMCERYPETGDLILMRLADAIAERMSNTNEQVVDLIKQGLAYGH